MLSIGGRKTLVPDNSLWMTTTTPTTTPGFNPTFSTSFRKYQPNNWSFKNAWYSLFARNLCRFGCPHNSHCEWGFCECDVGLVKTYVSSACWWWADDWWWPWLVFDDEQKCKIVPNYTKIPWKVVLQLAKDRWNIDKYNSFRAGATLQNSGNETLGRQIMTG